MILLNLFRIDSAQTIKLVFICISIQSCLCGFNSTIEGSRNGNVKELDSLKKLRKEVKDILYQPYMKEDKYLLPWLRAKNYDVESAAAMIRNAIEWRKRNNIDSILSEDWSSVERALPYRNDGVARDGSPILEIQSGKWSVRKFVLSGKRDVYNKYLTRISEHMATKVREQAAKTGNNNITQHISLYDLSGYNIREHGCVACIPAQLQTPRDFEAYFPQAFKALYFLNTPKVFEALLILLRPVMSPYTNKVLHVYGSNKHEWSQHIFKIVAPDQIMPGYGGTKY